MHVAIPITGETWLICGGRDFQDRDMFNSAMSQLTERFGIPQKIVTGGARGADYLGAEWADRHALQTHTELAQWNIHGKKAGPIRNQKMLDEQRPHKVIAFPGGRGTADMISRAKGVSGVDVVEIKPTDS